jgi:hypothetical protein
VREGYGQSLTRSETGRVSNSRYGSLNTNNEVGCGKGAGVRGQMKGLKGLSIVLVLVCLLATGVAPKPIHIAPNQCNRLPESHDLTLGDRYKICALLKRRTVVLTSASIHPKRLCN